MKRINWGIALAVVTLAGVLIGANGLKDGPSRVAVVDIRRVVVEYSKFTELKNTITAAQKAATEELNKRKGVITGLIEQRNDVKADSVDARKFDDLILQSRVEAQAFGEITRARLERQQFEGLRNCYKDIMEALAAYSNESNIDVVYSMRQVKITEAKNTQDLETLIAAKYVLYNNAGSDITDAVLKRLNTK
jgi:Skp family chaperone for outer membrane proteins